LKEIAWETQPDVVVTRGVIQTPEQYIPGIPLEGVWEANLTMGREWNYMPANDVYKTGGQLISTLVETRAKGGNLLLNVGPKPDGELPVEQEERLREIALWMFVNGEAIYGVRPWVVTNERDYWFTKKKDEDTLYVVVKEKERWKYGEWKEIVLKSVRAGDNTQASVLSQNDKVLEYQPGVIPKTTWKQESDGLHVRANNALRLYTDRKWPNPVVLKLTNVKPALKPPRVETIRGRWDNSSRTATFEGDLKDLGNASSLEVGFEYRDITGQDVNERTDSWTAVPVGVRSAAGAFRMEVRDLTPGRDYEVRALVKHPLLTLYGLEKRVSAK
jgi:alpha-L-fucosidase